MLLELTISLVITGIIASGIFAAVAMTLRGMPTASRGAPATIAAADIVDRLITELETAVYVTERSATAIGMTLPDRNGDGIPERVRYAWTGAAGGPLTRRYNGGSVVTIAPQVDQFNLTPLIKTVTEQYPAVATEDAAESLLIDVSTGGSNNNDLTATTWFGQYFSLTLPSDAYAWRPTRVELMAKKSSLGGISLVQTRPPTSAMTPSATVLEQQTMSETSLGINYGWQSFNLAAVDPLASGGAFCVVIRQQAGVKSATLQSTGDFPGLLKTSNTGTSWSYDGSKALVSRVYGKLTRSTETRTLLSKYLKSFDVLIRLAPTAPTWQATASCLNHPELLSGKWELKFDQNPTTADVNGDALADWSVQTGGPFNAASVSGGVWHADGGTQLRTVPDCDFAKTTVIDLKFRNTSVGGNGAMFTINALRSGAACAPVSAFLKRQSDGTQTLTVATKASDVQPRTLLNISSLPGQTVLLRLIVSPADSAVSIRVNDVEYGTFSIVPYVSGDGGRYAAIGSDISTAEYSYARIRVLED